MFVISFASLLCAAAARPSLSYLENHFTAENESEEVRSAAIKRLLEVFGMEDPPAIIHGHKQAPQYMLDLYNTVADVDGVTKDPYLLEGNTVRSFFDKRKIRFLRAHCLRLTVECEPRPRLFWCLITQIPICSAQRAGGVQVQFVHGGQD